MLLPHACAWPCAFAFGRVLVLDRLPVDLLPPQRSQQQRGPRPPAERGAEKELEKKKQPGGSPSSGITIGELPDGEPQQIGRSSESLPLADQTISRRHAELTPDDGHWHINDINVVNGVVYCQTASLREWPFEFRLVEVSERTVSNSTSKSVA